MINQLANVILAYPITSAQAYVEQEHTDFQSFDNSNATQPVGNVVYNTFEDINVDSDLILQFDKEVGNVNLLSGNLNLNGHKLTVHGVFVK